MYECRQDNRDERCKCEHSACRMRVFPLPPCHLERIGRHRPKARRGIDRVGKRPEEALRRYNRDKRSERQCEGSTVGAQQQRVRQRRQQRDADHRGTAKAWGPLGKIPRASKTRRVAQAPLSL